MSALAIAPAALDRAGEQRTLDDLITAICDALAAGEVVPCPVCGGELEPAAAGREPTGRCKECGVTFD
jgi:hypothetical protein